MHNSHDGYFERMPVLFIYFFYSSIILERVSCIFHCCCMHVGCLTLLGLFPYPVSCHAPDFLSSPMLFSLCYSSKTDFEEMFMILVDASNLFYWN